MFIFQTKVNLVWSIPSVLRFCRVDPPPKWGTLQESTKVRNYGKTSSRLRLLHSNAVNLQTLRGISQNRCSLVESTHLCLSQSAERFNSCLVHFLLRFFHPLKFFFVSTLVNMIFVDIPAVR